MSNTKYSSFEKYEFIGEFFISESSYSTSFPGKVQYDLESGLILSFNIADTDFPKQADVLLGILDNGQKCTLIGPFDFSQTGMRIGKIVTRYGKRGFRFLALGEFLSMDTLYGNARFTFSHMQEFFYPQGWIDSVKYKEGVIEKIEGAGWDLEVENRATFTDITHSLKNLLLTKNESIAKEIVTNVNSILSKSENEHLLIRKTLEFLFNFQSEEDLDIHGIYDALYKITSLFSILMNVPVFPDEIKLYSHSEVSVQILAGQTLEARTVELAKNKPSYHFMPINRSSVNLTTSLIKWFELYDSYQVLSTTFQYETNFRTLHAAYSDIILYLANVEAIAIDLGTHKNSKYVSAIEKYACSKLTNSLNSIFTAINNNDLGKNLSDIRGELAHEGRPKVLMHKLDISDYIEISRLLKLIVVSHLLSKLGFDEGSIHDYQNKLIP
ncbi:hypothetical protein BZG25_15555 [Salinivibrio sp. ML198]|uniref:ApeA N-terminal domain 1-containing protein n=1 Tax=Salinivibrio sp. ML198 TaxID=1909458 RepID=UPI000988F40C|nr:HEPN domain-containing protein [Salinivibrio sp. ML198]OOE76267.1 hypothetical protein BZG25_15555 [Salinivibrio sp. ML198]